jgi:beta-1,4-mannosyltransferase
MRILMFPAHGNKNENRYIDIIVEALTNKGVNVSHWSKEATLQGGDIFHIHWPELISDIYLRPHQGLRGQIIKYNFFSTVARIKRAGGKVVWTAHDIQPHDPRIKELPFHKDLMNRFLPNVDAILSLTHAGIPMIADQLPAVRDKRFFVCHHPHYRNFHAGFGARDETRRRYGIAPQQKLLSLIGTLRPNKGADRLAAAFRDLPEEHYALLIAGACDSQYGLALKSAAGDAPNIFMSLERVPERDIYDLYAATDALVFPGLSYFNSATIYTALSHNTPVIIADTPVNREIQGLVGAQWMQLYSGDLTGDKVSDMTDHLIDRANGEKCDLSSFDPSRCAEEHIAAYKSIL